MTIDLPPRQQPPRTLTIIGNPGESHCELGAIGYFGVERDADGRYTGNVSYAPPIVAIEPGEQQLIRNYQEHGWQPYWQRQASIETTIVGDLLHVKAANGTWLYRLHPATWRGDNGYLVGAWPD